MNKFFLTVSTLAISTSVAMAGGLDRSGQGIGLIFEDGGYVELSYGMVTPSVTGSLAGGAVPSGSMAATYSQVGLGVKQDISDKLSFAIILDQPFGASVDYPTSAATYPLAGTTATIDSQSLNAIGRYKVSERASVHVGLRSQSISGSATIVNPLFPANYLIDMNGSTGIGYSVGAAYEIPDIALRVAVTYNSAIEHTMSGVEGFGVSAPAVDFNVTTPQSVNIDFQSGVAANTLVFGSVRWVDWTSFDFSPVIYSAATGGPLISYDSDVFSYTLGVGRKFSDTFSGSIAVGYEAATATPATPSSNLSPTDGNFSVQIGGKYTMGDMIISGGVRYLVVGDATTEILGASFTDNTAIAVGLKVGYSF